MGEKRFLGTAATKKNSKFSFEIPKMPEFNLGIEKI